MNVLIVDDNVMDRKYVKCLLENYLNLSPHTAKDGLDAITKIKYHHFDLVITDIVMPNMDGIELIQYLKINYPFIDIISISGNNPCYLEIANKLGVDKIFTKPVDLSKFIEVTRLILQNRTNTACA
jgi:CheY-like chemotaxis protein